MSIDDVLNPGTRMSLVALLAAVEWAEFGRIRDELGLSNSALSKQLSSLEDAGYATVDRSVRRRVRAGLTEQGREAFQQYVARLVAIAQSSQAAGPGLPPGTTTPAS